jgi:nickel transport protein
MSTRFSPLLTLLPLLAGIFQLFSGQASAHSVHIFAWADARQICSESYFTRSSRVRGGEVVMADESGSVLGRGRTDESGLACFPLPLKAQDLTFTILAGQGHKGKFLLRAQDMAAAFPQSSSTARENSAAPPAAAPPASAPEADDVGLREIVRQELQGQLAPIQRNLAELKEDKTPGPREIIGGIGWIMGLSALAQWAAARRNRRDNAGGKG